MQACKLAALLAALPCATVLAQAPSRATLLRRRLGALAVLLGGFGLGVCLVSSALSSGGDEGAPATVTRAAPVCRSAMLRPTRRSTCWTKDWSLSART